MLMSLCSFFVILGDHLGRGMNVFFWHVYCMWYACTYICLNIHRCACMCGHVRLTLGELLLSTLFNDIELLTEPTDGQYWLI